MSVSYTEKEPVAVALYGKLNAVSEFQSVDRQYVEMGDYDYPGVFINDVREVRRTVLKDVVHVLWTVLIVVFVFDDSLTLSTTLNAEIKRAIDALKVDVTLGVSGVYNTRVLDVDTDEGFLRPHGVAMLTTEISYLTKS